MTWRGSYYTELTPDCFLQVLLPFVSFSHFINRETAWYGGKYCLKGPVNTKQPTNQFINRSSCLCNSSYIFQGILIKLSSYCFHDLKMIIFYWGHARLIFTRVMALWQFSILNLVSATPLAVFNRFFQLLFPWLEEDHIKPRSLLTAFCQSYGPLSFITIEKPRQHNILITTWARILIFGIWLRINVYMTWLTCEQSPWNI